jgi:very-short-patch-repair endonuclease
LETDGKFHDEQVEEDKIRTRNITKHYSNIKVIRWRWNDFGSYTKMKELLSVLT